MFIILNQRNPAGFFQVLLPLRLTNTFLTESFTDTVAILSTLWDSQAYMTGCMAHKLCHVFDGAIYTFVNYFRLDRHARVQHRKAHVCTNFKTIWNAC